MEEDIGRIIENSPKYLFLSYGANDLEMWVGDVTSFIKYYKNKIIYLREILPNTKIIINSILPVRDDVVKSDIAFTYQELFNEELKKLAQQEKVQFLENSQFLKEKENPFTTDGIHPQPYFFHLWGRHMASYLNNN